MHMAIRLGWANLKFEDPVDVRIRPWGSTSCQFTKGLRSTVVLIQFDTTTMAPNTHCDSQKFINWLFFDP